MTARTLQHHHCRHPSPQQHGRAPTARLYSSVSVTSDRTSKNNKTASSSELRVSFAPFHHRNLSTTTSSSSSVFKPWPADTNGVVTCHGDYRQEAWLEEHIGGPLYAKQKDLPRLPVPDLKDTVSRFLPTALCLARTEQERQDLLDKAAKFPQQAAHLQQRLLERASTFNESNSSWLQHWWNHQAYLDFRDTVVINVSYFFHLQDDASALRAKENAQVRRAAALLTAAAQVRQQVCSGTWPVDSVGRGERKKELCSTAYKYMFHATRIPTTTRDTVRLYDPARHHHALVSCRGHFFQVPMADPVTGQALPLSVLEQSLQDCIHQANRLDKEATTAPKLGTLTSWNRDDWTVARQALLDAGGSAMEESLQRLESACLLICLDVDEQQAPVGRDECAKWFLHGSTDPNTPSGVSVNRWWDKSIQLVVCRNGKAGLIGEHSMMDGMPMVGMANHLCQHTYDKCVATESSLVASTATTGGSVSPIFGPELYPAMQAVQSHVERARVDYTKLVDGNSLHVQSFQGYGSDFIKKAGFSPDAYVQMAMQIATYRLWGDRQGGTYEATQVRPFLHGRTEVARAVSEQSAAMVREGFGLAPQRNEHIPEERERKLKLLQNAVTAHIKFIGLAAQGEGVDRHFFGLANLVQEGEEAPELFSDPTFTYSKRWRVSTSHLTHPKFDGWGFGQVVPDGVGIAYSIHPRHCVFNIAALKEHGWTSQLSALLEEALLEMRTLVELGQADKDGSAPKSKL